MTKKVLISLCVLLFIFGSIAGYFYHQRVERLRDPEQCTASVVVYYNDVRANMTLDFMYTLEKRTGVVAVSGTYFQNNKPLGVIRQDVAYTWTENKDNLRFHSTRVHKVTNDAAISDDLLNNVLPDFYVYPNKTVSYTILTQGHRGFIFTIGKRPIFFCAH
jgi:hypothetical protein